MKKRRENMKKGKVVVASSLFVFMCLSFLIGHYVAATDVTSYTVDGVTYSLVNGETDIYKGSDNKFYKKVDYALTSEYDPGGYIFNEYDINSKKIVTGGKSADVNYQTKATDPMLVIGNIFGWLLYMVAVAAGWIVSALVFAMLSVMSYPINTHLDAVTNGWVAVRDLCNNFFIVLLIAIAIGTIIKIPQWQIKELLPKLLVMAILINFSKMFCGIMIDVSQILMLSFAAPLQTITGSNIILNAIGIPDMYQLMGNTTDKSATATSYLNEGAATLAKNLDINYFNIITALIYALIASVIAAAVMVAIMAILVYRIVTLLFLTVLSPLPFLLSTFKKGQEYAGQWWKMMTAELVVGPVMLFFLWLAFMIMGYNGARQNQITAGQTSRETDQTKAFLAGKDGSTITQFTKLSKAMSTEGVINFALVIGMLMAALVMGQKTGAAGSAWAGSAMSFLDKQRKSAQALPWRATKSVGRTTRTLAGYAGTGIDDRLRIREGLSNVGFKVAKTIGKPLGLENFLSRPFSRLAAGYASEAKKRQKSQIANIEEMAANASNVSAEERLADMEKGTRDQKVQAAKDFIQYDVARPSNKVEAEQLEALKKILEDPGIDEDIKVELRDAMTSKAQARSLEIFTPEQLQKARMNGKFDIAAAVRKLDTNTPNGKKWMQKLFEAFHTVRLDKDGNDIGADFNGFISYVKDDVDSDPKQVAAIISSFQSRKDKKEYGRNLDQDTLRELITKGRKKDAQGNIIDEGEVDEELAMTIGGTLMAQGIVSTKEFSGVFRDSKGILDAESATIMKRLIERNADQISANFEDMIAQADKLDAAGKSPEAKDLRDAVMRQMSDINSSIGHLLGGATCKKLRGVQDAQKKIAKDALTDSVIHDVTRISELREKNKDALAYDLEDHRGEEKTEEYKRSAGIQEKYKKMVSDFKLSGEHVAQGSAKVDFVGMLDGVSKISSDPAVQAKNRELITKDYLQQIGKLKVNEINGVQIFTAPAGKPDLNSLAFSTEFTKNANGLKLEMYSRSGEKHGSNTGANSKLWQAVAKVSEGRKADQLTDADYEKMKKAIYETFNIDPSNPGELAEQQTTKANLQKILANLQENAEVWKIVNPKGIDAAGSAGTAPVGGTTRKTKPKK